MTLEELNGLPEEAAKKELTKCCGSSVWLDKMVAIRPFENEAKLFEVASSIWFACTRNDWLEAFSHHPRIGDINILQEKFADTREWEGQEQESVGSARQDILEKLAQKNKKYEERFGYIFIVYATGKSADEMLEIVERRLRNNSYDEIKIAISEQNQITRLRLKKLLS